MIEVSAGIVVSDGKILCFRKGESKYPYLSRRYEFPGGKIKKGESPEDALILEFEEELGADISKSELTELSVICYAYPDFKVTIRYFVVGSENFGFTLKEHESFVWAKPEELKTLDWAEADSKVVPALEGYLAG